jgi:hypothetical protein
MLDDASLSHFNYFLTSGMLQPNPLKEISSRDLGNDITRGVT